MPTHVYRGFSPSILFFILISFCAGRGATAAPPFHGTLFTPVEKNNAIGPPNADAAAYYPYQPRELRELTDVASAVRETLATHLSERLGTAFYARLKFAGGEAVNLDELHRMLPASRKFSREVPTYLLWFEFEMPEVGIRVYTASIALRRDGSVIREIDLPPFAREPGKLRFAPLAEVSARLAAEGAIDEKTTTVNIAYDPKSAQMIWHYEQALPGESTVVNVRKHRRKREHRGGDATIHQSRRFLDDPCSVWSARIP